jgi:excinuclease UvrABC ATPase subunit
MGKTEEIDLQIRDLIKNGYYRIWEEGEILDLTTLPLSALQNRSHLFLLVDRVIPDEKNRSRLAEAIQSGFQLGSGKVEVMGEDGRKMIFNRTFSQLRKKAPGAEPLLFSFNILSVRVLPVRERRIIESIGRKSPPKRR